MTVLLTILAAIVVFGTVILVHESGHFFTAKLCGVKVNEFALGMGPKLVGFGKKETKYSLRLLPIGGYVSMEGEDEVSDDPRSFSKAAVWKRILIVVAGAVMNLILGFLVLCLAVGCDEVITSRTVSGFYENASTQATGLEVGDTILSVNGRKCYIANDILYEFARTGVPVLPGVGTSLGEVQVDQMLEVNIPKQLSADIQKLRDSLDAPAVCCSPFVGLVIPRVSAEGSLRTVGVVNTRIDIQEEIKIRLAGVPEKAKVTWHELKKKPLRCRVESVDGQTYVMIPQIAAWNAGFLEIRNKK